MPVMFSKAIAALSEKVAPMESLIRGFVDQADFQSLRHKLDRAHHMFLNLFKVSPLLGVSPAR